MRIIVPIVTAFYCLNRLMLLMLPYANIFKLSCHFIDQTGGKLFRIVPYESFMDYHTSTGTGILENCNCTRSSSGMKSIHSEPVFCFSLNLDNRIRLMTAEKTADGAIPGDSVGKNLRKQEVLLIYDKK